MLGEPPGDRDFAVGVTAGEPGLQPAPGVHGHLVGAAVQHPLDALQRVVAVPAAGQVSCCPRRPTSSTPAKPKPTTWNASSTRTASGSSVRSAVAYPQNGSSATKVICARQAGSGSASQSA